MSLLCPNMSVIFRRCSYRARVIKHFPIPHLPSLTTKEGDRERDISPLVHSQKREGESEHVLDSYTKVCITSYN